MLELRNPTASFLWKAGRQARRSQGPPRTESPLLGSAVFDHSACGTRNPRVADGAGNERAHPSGDTTGDGKRFSKSRSNTRQSKRPAKQVAKQYAERQKVPDAADFGAALVDKFFGRIKCRVCFCFILN